MKTTKKQGITYQQKQYLQRRVAYYLLCAAIVHSTPVKRPKPPPKNRAEIPQVRPEPTVPKAERPSAVRQPGWFRRGLHSRGARLAYVSIGLIVFVVLAQLAYPSGRALPFSRLQSAGYLGFADKNTILSNFDDFDSRVVTVHTHNKSITTSYRDLGVSIEPLKTVDDMTDYPFRDRLIPFSIFVKGNKNYPISRTLDDSQLSLFVDNVIAQASKQQKDAHISLKGTQFIVEPSEDGYEYQKSVLESRVLKSDLSDRAEIIFTPTILHPAITTDDANTVSSRMQERIDNPLLINAEQHSIRVLPDVMASWVDIEHRPKENVVRIIFNKKRVDAWLRPFASEVDKKPVATVVTYLNGREAGRVEGKVGKSLDYQDLLSRVVDNTSPLTSTLEASVKTLSPPQVIDRRYSRDSQGLQTLINYWTANHGGNYSIDIRTVNGQISAGSSPHLLLPSVGIYRIYIASLIYGRITAGSTTLNTPTQAGRTVQTCLELMMTESDTSCTNALGSIVGWGANDSLLKAQGFDTTTLTQGASLTSASDTSAWMLKLLAGNITTLYQANDLTDIMSRQSLRSGIPAGSVGMRVADKAGSDGRYAHDVGIVYHPNGTYVLSVLSDGGDFGSIAELAKEINKVMDQ